MYLSGDNSNLSSYNDIFLSVSLDIFFVSDLKIKVGDRHISAHKFVLAARSDSWSLANLSSTEEIDLSGKSAYKTIMYHFEIFVV
jgi:hypothetical protein